MSRMTRDNWLAYAIMRNEFGIDRAEQYRHKCNKRNAQYGLTSNKPSELPQWTLVTADFDSRTEKRFFPGEYSARDIDNLFDRFYIEAPNSMYDCTGREFTISMDVHIVPSGIWLYHRIGIDV